MERLPIWLSAVGERTAGPGTADMNRFPLHGMRQLRLPMALITRKGHAAAFFLARRLRAASAAADAIGFYAFSGGSAC